MDKTLGYLRETLSNYTDEHHSIAKQLYHKLTGGHYKTEEAFVRQLSQKEIGFLNQILQNEIQYAKQEQDEKRAYELNEVYELLF
ncbi:sporulation protein [Bacillus sp. BRMEA1]|uniref:sigma-G-dependent sporulation-specific acid-soluble spore protein CsgA n=1 Tax=Neobacillus endophyticus TaxID=2738405 RepID=UPI0015677205|nr:sigma-G-dependent sporulation-specific acid-soluble spore protein CsgA [Neobacillus endophyticus]NRD80360.1 sporulation protein [Neobacillus endophyticus]